MKKKILALGISAIIIVVLVITIFQLSSQGLITVPPITAATIGPGWELEEALDVEDGTRWTYVKGEEKMIIRIRELESDRQASLQYINLFTSNSTKFADFTGLGENGFIGIYHNEEYSSGPWLLLVTQEGTKYTEIAYMNKNSKYYGSITFDEDAEWIKKLAKQL